MLVCGTGDYLPQLQNIKPLKKNIIRRGDRRRDGEEHGECWHQHRSQPEPGEQGETGNDESDEGDERVLQMRPRTDQIRP